MGFLDFLNKTKAVSPEGDGPLATVLRNWTSAESPRLTQSNMADYLSRYADQAWVFSCIKIIQTKAASVPLKVYRNNGTGDEELQELHNHPLQILLNQVNPYMSGYDLLESLHGFIELVGNAYWLKDKIVDGKASELYPLNPKCIKIIADKKGFITGYEYSIEAGKVERTFKPEEIVHFKTWNPLSDFYGLAPICAARDSADTILFSDQYNKAFFKNGAEPGGFLTSDKEIDEDDRNRLVKMWRKLHQGVRKAHQVAILDSGLKFTPSSASHKDMAYGELKRMSREDVLTVFNLPPIMVGVFDEANYSNAREQRKIFWQDCIIPRLRKIESRINEFLARDWDNSGKLLVRHDLSGVEDLAADADLRSRADALNVTTGILTVNEIRKQKNLDPVPWGDTWYAPFGLSPVGTSGVPKPIDEEEPTQTPPPEESKALVVKRSIKETPLEEPIDPKKVRRDNVWMKYKGLTDRLERKWVPSMRSLFNDQERDVINKLRESDWKKTLNQNKLDKFTKVKVSIDLILFDRVHARTIFRKEASRLLKETVGIAAAAEIAEYELGIDFNIVNPNVVTWIENKAFKFANEVNTTTEDALRQELSDAITSGEALTDVEDRVARVFDIARGSRTAAIARTEVVAASNEGAVQSYKQSGLVSKIEWVSSRDNLVRDDHQIDGETIELSGGLFSNGLRYPGDPAGTPENVINCRCTVAPLMEKGSE